MRRREASRLAFSAVSAAFAGRILRPSVALERRAATIPHRHLSVAAASAPNLGTAMARNIQVMRIGAKAGGERPYLGEDAGGRGREFFLVLIGKL